PDLLVQGRARPRQSGCQTAKREARYPWLSLSGKPGFSTLDSSSGRETDSPLEEDGFEPLVPPGKGTACFETTLIDLRPPPSRGSSATLARGTGGSNPFRSAGESCPGGERECTISVARTRLYQGSPRRCRAEAAVPTSYVMLIAE